MCCLGRKIEELADSCGGVVSVSVRNVRNAFDFSLNAGARVIAGSTIKVPILIEGLRQVKAGRLSLASQYAISRAKSCGGSGVISHLSDGILLSIQDLLTLMIIVSDNTATNALIDIVGMHSVNKTMHSLDCPGIALNRKMYDWDAVKQGRENYVVASEMTDLLGRLARREVVSPELDALAHEILRAQLYTDLLGLFLPEGVLANKTGQVATAVNDCAIVTTDSFCYAIAVFTQDTACLGETKIAIGRISKLVYDAVACKNCG